MVGVLVSGCQSRTELIIGVATDLHAKDDFDGVDLVVAHATSLGAANTGPMDSQHFDISGAPNIPDNLPGSYGIYSDGDETALDITLTGTKGGTTIVTRHAVVSLVNGQTLFYRLTLAAVCETMMDCPIAGQTCVEGTCVDLLVNSKQFPAFSDDLVGQLTCASTIKYIDTSDNNQPMTLSANANQCAAGLCQEGTCLNPLPSCSTDDEIAACEAGNTACNVGCNTTSCHIGNGSGDGDGCATTIGALSVTDACRAAECAALACETSAGTSWGTGTDGTCTNLGCDDAFVAAQTACAAASQRELGKARAVPR